MSGDNVTESQWSWYSYINPLNVGYLWNNEQCESNGALGRNAPRSYKTSELKSSVNNMGLLGARLRLKTIDVSDATILQARNNLKSVITNSHKHTLKPGDSYEKGSPLRELHEVFGVPIEPEEYA